MYVVQDRRIFHNFLHGIKIRVIHVCHHSKINRGEFYVMTLNRPEENSMSLLHHGQSFPPLLFFSFSLPTISLLPTFLQVVSEGFSEDTQWHSLSLLQLATSHSLLAQLEFCQLKGIGLVQQVLRSPQAAVGNKIAEV